MRNIKKDDIKDIEGISILNIIGKGQIQHQTPLHPTTAYYLKMLIESYKDDGFKNTQWVFRAKNKNNISKNKLSSTAIN